MNREEFHKIFVSVERVALDTDLEFKCVFEPNGKLWEGWLEQEHNGWTTKYELPKEMSVRMAQILKITIGDIPGDIESEP